MMSKGVQQNGFLKALTILTATLTLVALAACGGGGGGGSDRGSDADKVTITGVVDDGGTNSPIPDAGCTYIDIAGQTQDTDDCGQDGSFQLSVPSGTEGYIYCGPQSLPDLNLTTFSSTVDFNDGETKPNENVTPTTTVVADIIRYENPPDPELRKAELITQAYQDPNLAIVAEIAGRLYRAMLARQVNARFGDDRSGGRGDGGDGDGGSDSDGGVGGEAGDGADFSPLIEARCAFVIGDDFQSAERIYPAALADYLGDGQLDRPDLAGLAATVSEELGYSDQQIRQAFEAWFPEGLGEELATITDQDGYYFLPVPPNLPGYVRCTPKDRQQLVLGTYTPGRPADAGLAGQDVTPPTTIFTALIASQLQGELAELKDNYLKDIEGLRVLLSGPNLPGAGPLDDIRLSTETLPRNSEVGIVAFSATALFNIFHKNGLNTDFLALISTLEDHLTADMTIDPVFLEGRGLPRDQAEKVSDAIKTAGDRLDTDLQKGLSTARLVVTVRDAEGPLSGALVTIDEEASGVSCDEGCNAPTDQNGRITLVLNGVPMTATQIDVTASATGYQSGNITVQVVAFATVYVTVQLTPSDAPAGTISGTVADASEGTPLAGAQVTVYDGNQRIASATTNSQGNYTIRCAAGSGYTVVFQAEGYISTRYANVAVETDTNSFLEAVLQVSEAYAGSGDISGTILDAVNNIGIGGVSLQLRAGINNVSGDPIDTTTTATDGSYTFNDIPAGVYTVFASYSGYTDTRFTVYALGGETSGGQDASMSPELGSGEIRIVLRWGSTPWDLDSHLSGPSSDGGEFHCYYYEPVPDPGYVNLDRDDTDGEGPETITIQQRLTGTYRYLVHDYTNRYSTTSSALSSSGAHVRVYGESGELAAFNVPTGQGGTVWEVFELDGTSGQITPRNQISYEDDPREVRQLYTDHESDDFIELLENLPEKITP
jgi:hypothetical protein